jgi:elongation factor Ts
MTTITSEHIKELRERTGVGMAKCKEALEEAKGDMDQAISILRKAGMASAVKKQGREAKEGLVTFKETDKVIAFAEINAETDFVAKNERFQEFAKNILDEVAVTQPESLESFLQQPYSKDPSITIDQYRSLIIQTIGENILISRIAVWQKKPGHSVGLYSHMNGKILTAVELSADGAADVARDVAMHAAAAAPEYLAPSDVPEHIVEKEREIGRDQVQGKPAQIIDKIVEGKVNAFFDTVCLVKQKFVKDTSMSVETFINEKAKSSGKQMQAVRFMRWMLGQA